MREPDFAGEARSFIGSAQQQQSARGDCRHVHAAKGAHLTPLTGAAHARNCIRRAREHADYATHCKRAAYMNTSRNIGRLQYHYIKICKELSILFKIRKNGEKGGKC